MNVTLSRSQLLAILSAVPALAYARAAGAQGAPWRIGSSPSEIFSEPVYVMNSGFLNRVGLNAEIMPFTTGGQMVQAVLGGSLDLGLSDMTAIANAVNRDLPLSFVAASGMYRTESPSTLLCLAKNSPVRAAKDLEGEAIGVNGLRTMAEISTREWLKQNGADPAKLKSTEIPASIAVPALERGTVAATIVGEPFFTAAGDRIRLLAKPYDMVAKTFYVSGWFGKREWIAQNAAAMKKFVGVIYETARWANTHHDETAPWLATWLKLETAAVKAGPRATFATTMDPKLMQPVLDIALRYNVIEKAVEAATLIQHLD